MPHLDSAYNLARWLTRNDADAQDVVQEAMLRAFKYFDGFDGQYARAWLLQIVRNAAFASARLNRGMRIVSLDDAEEKQQLPASPAEDPEAALIRSSGERRVHELIAALPVELREPLVLRELEELSYKEIAEITQVPIGTVMSRLWRARQLLVRAAAEGGRP